MIFATVGTQLPFDRLIMTIDKWQSFHGVKGCFAQIGPKGQTPKTLSHAATLTPEQFAKNIANCKVIVSHAGMGTILTALGAGMPIMIMPRLAKHGEHRNDHQLATVDRLRGRAGIHVARDESELTEKLDHINALKAGEGFSTDASPELLAAVSNFVAPAKQEIIHAV